MEKTKNIQQKKLLPMRIELAPEFKSNAFLTETETFKILDAVLHWLKSSSQLVNQQKSS